jgi:hypothetical protein
MLPAFALFAHPLPCNAFAKLFATPPVFAARRCFV